MNVPKAVTAPVLQQAAAQCSYSKPEVTCPAQPCQASPSAMPKFWSCLSPTGLPTGCLNPLWLRAAVGARLTPLQSPEADPKQLSSTSRAWAGAEGQGQQHPAAGPPHPVTAGSAPAPPRQRIGICAAPTSTGSSALLLCLPEPKFLGKGKQERAVTAESSSLIHRLQLSITVPNCVRLLGLLGCVLAHLMERNGPFQCFLDLLCASAVLSGAQRTTLEQTLQSSL